ncbi:MAG: hypothetical protein HeimC2_33060 [Candidatus Heimdallarchaeota archaeon LC_2]|nr:MAG: hypothetical protein HeimC2_33060 [Candidatus Heimdallarchaeota archaeon LC_2]
MNYVSSNRKLSVIAIALFFIFVLVSQSPANAQTAYVDNNVDSDSDQDSVSNKGTSASTSYLDAQVLDASDETIFEKDIGKGISQINENWTNYKYININHHQVLTDLTGFPVLISIVDKDIKRNAQLDDT